MGNALSLKVAFQDTNKRVGHNRDQTAGVFHGIKGGSVLSELGWRFFGLHSVEGRDILDNRF